MFKNLRSKMFIYTFFITTIIQFNPTQANDQFVGIFGSYVARLDQVVLLALI